MSKPFYLLIAFALVMLGACGPRATAYPPEFELNFMSACQVRDAPEGYCDCVWGKIRDEIPVEEFIGFDAAMQTSQPHPVQSKIEGFTRECAAAARR